MWIIAPIALGAAVAGEIIERHEIEAIRRQAYGDRDWEPGLRVLAVDPRADHFTDAPTRRALGLIALGVEGADRQVIETVRLLQEALVNGRIGPEGPDTYDEANRLIRERGLDRIEITSHPTGGFLELRAPGYVIELEGWQDRCIDEGWGRYSIYEHGPDAPAPPCSDEPEAYLSACVYESDLRKAGIAPGHPDGPPEGVIEWLGDLWLINTHADDAFVLNQITVWRTR